MSLEVEVKVEPGKRRVDKPKEVRVREERALHSSNTFVDYSSRLRVPIFGSMVRVSGEKPERKVIFYY